MEFRNYKIVDEDCGDIRAIARAALKGNWQKGLFATIVYFIFFELVSSILTLMFPAFPGKPELASVSFAGGLYQLITTGAFTLGYVGFCLAVLRKKEASITQVFEGFEHVLKATLLTIVMGIFIVLWSCLFIIPGFIAAFRYSQAYNIMHDHPEYGIMQCIGESKRMMAGNKMKLFVLMLSYIGWLLLVTVPTMILVTIVGASTGNMLPVPPYATLSIEAISMLFTAPVTLYMIMGEMVFYDMAAGNLVRHYVDEEPMQNQQIIDTMPNDPIVSNATQVQDTEAQKKDTNETCNMENRVRLVDAEIVGRAESGEVIDVTEDEIKKED